MPPAARVWKGTDVLWMTIVSVLIFFPILVGIIMVAAGTTSSGSFDENIIETNPLISFSIFLLEPVALIVAIYLIGLKRRGYNWRALGFFRSRAAWLLGACGLGLVFLPLNGMINLTVESIFNPEYGRQLMEAAGLDSDNPFDFPADDDPFGSNLFLQTLSSFDTPSFNPTPFFAPTQRPLSTPLPSINTPAPSSGIGSNMLATGDPQLRPSRTSTPFPTPNTFSNDSFSDTTDFSQRALLDSAANTPLGIIGTLLLAGLAVPIAEEMFFRGVLYAWLRSKWGIWIGTIVSSLVFGLLHGSPGMVAATFVLGSLAAILYENSRSLWPAIILHATNNLLVLLLQYLVIS